MLQRGVRVVGGLRQQPAEADAVGRTQRRLRGAASSSDSACLASRWQSSKLPSTRNARTLSPQQPSPCACRGDTRPSGYRITTLKPGRRWNAAATAAPVSPEVATRIVVGGASARAARQGFGEEARGVVLECGGGAVEQLEQPVVFAVQAGAGVQGTKRRARRCRRAGRAARNPRSTARARACAVSASVRGGLREQTSGSVPARTARRRARGRRRARRRSRLADRCRGC